MKPTPEQEKICDLVASGAPVVTQAGAGTGKTTQFHMIADTLLDQGRFGLYTAFNRSVAQSVQFRQGNVKVGTFHSLCFDIAARDAGIASVLGRLGHGVSRNDVPAVAGVGQPLAFETYAQRNAARAGSLTNSGTLLPVDICQGALDTITRWCSSDREVITPADVPRVTTMTETFHDEVYAPYIAELATHLWVTDICNPAGNLRFTHDHYLKMVSLLKPSFTKEFGLPYGTVLMYDEAQDARPSMLSLILAQSDMQLVAVGDSAQAIYGFTGARDALTFLSAFPTVEETTLSVSWRFGDGLAEVANPLLRELGSPVHLQGNPDKETSVGLYSGHTPKAHAVLTRTNAQLLAEAHAEMKSGRSVHVEVDRDLIKRVSRDITKIERGLPVTSMELRGFSSVAELAAFLSTEPEPSPVLSTAKFIIDVGMDTVERIMEQTVPESEADVTVITAHKSKGRQWPRVRIAMTPQDIAPSLIRDPDNAEQERRDRLMLLYVAITRAQEKLFIPADVASAVSGTVAWNL